MVEQDEGSLFGAWCFILDLDDGAVAQLLGLANYVRRLESEGLPVPPS